MRKLLLAVLTTSLVLSGCSFKKNSPTPEVTPSATPSTGSLASCYVAHLAKDEYSIEITSQSEGLIQGNVYFHNFEKDSSYGKFTGALLDNQLLGTYDFWSEGVLSHSEVIFKLENGKLFRGFGPSTQEGEMSSFVRPLDITWDESYAFEAASKCPVMPTPALK
jgi:hypothetical protein